MSGSGLSRLLMTLCGRLGRMSYVETVVILSRFNWGHARCLWNGDQTAVCGNTSATSKAILTWTRQCAKIGTAAAAPASYSQEAIEQNPKY